MIDTKIGGKHETRNSFKSLFNLREVELIRSLLEMLRRKKVQMDRVTVITMYKA